MSCKKDFENLPKIVEQTATLPATTGNIAMVCQDARNLFPKLNWKKYVPQKQTGKMCYFCCNSRSGLPIRDLTNDFASGYKMEPNYETGTYNVFKSCNQPSIAAALRAGLSHLFYITKYSGIEKEYQGKYFIVGLAEITATAKINNRNAVHGEMAFTDIEHAYEITPERWQKICPEPKHPSLRNLRWATQQIEGEMFEEIKNGILEHNLLPKYVEEVERLNEVRYEIIREKEQETFLVAA